MLSKPLSTAARRLLRLGWFVHADDGRGVRWFLAGCRNGLLSEPLSAADRGLLRPER